MNQGWKFQIPNHPNNGKQGSGHSAGASQPAAGEEGHAGEAGGRRTASCGKAGARKHSGELQGNIRDQR